MEQEPDIFDRIAAQASAPLLIDAQPKDELSAHTEQAPEAQNTSDSPTRTPQAVRKALQYVLANGWLESATKPHMFRLIAAQMAQLDVLLEPLDLQVVVDDVRGLAFLAVVPGYENDEADESEQDDWTHPLMRRQRLTLEQSLLLAILRREFLQREQEGGIGRPVQIAVDSLLPQLEIYLGSTGSDMQERKRLAALLEHLRGHGVVSDVDAQERITIRPMIAHLANPENLQALLTQLRALSADSTGNAT